MSKRSILTLGAFLLVVPLACGDDDGSGGSGNSTATSGNNNAGGGTTTGGNNAGGGTNSAGSNPGGGTTTGGNNAGGGNVGGQPPLQIGECQGHVYQCGNLVDDDNDGLVDSYDPDCLGPCDNTEDSYYGGIPGQAGPPCKVDCYFDQDSGPGNDDCHWDHNCDPHEVDPNYYPEPDNGTSCSYEGDDFNINPNYDCTDAQAAQSDQCMNYCGPLTPNGCDCFGCCELPAQSGQFVWLGSVGANENTVCTLAEVNNPEVCHPCIQVAACVNDCDPCEICIGQPEPGPECNPGEGGAGQGGAGQGGAGQGGGGGGTQCAPGIQPCGLPGQDPCPFGQYCITGCCIAEPPG